MSNTAGNAKTPDDDIPTIGAFQRIKKVKLQLTQGGPTTTFTLKEMFGGIRQEWQESQRQRYGLDYSGQPAGLTKFKGLEADLISKCLFDENDKPIPAEMVQGWPSSTQAALYQLCIQLNAISEKDIAKLKVD